MIRGLDLGDLRESFKGWGDAKPFKKGGEVMRGAYSLMPIKDAMMKGNPLAMKTGGIVDEGLYKAVQNIGFGNKTYIPTI
jgi:hypothetical protein